MTSFYDHSTPEEILEAMTEAIARLRAEIARLRAAADDTTGKIREVKSTAIFGERKHSIADYHRPRWGEPGGRKAVEKARAHAEELWAQAQAIHERNISAIEANKETYTKLARYMDNIGFPRTWTTYEFKTRRSRTKTKVSHTAGWRKDASTWLKTDDGFTSARHAYEDFLRDIERYEEKVIQQERESARKKEAESKRKQQERGLAVLIGKYGLDIESEPYDVIMATLDKDKYLMLGHWLEQNRLDWNEGCHYAELGLRQFEIETPEDQEIYDDIAQHCGEGWCDDGRVFRDTTWNYGALFAKAGNEVYADYKIVVEMGDRS